MSVGSVGWLGEALRETDMRRREAGGGLQGGGGDSGRRGGLRGDGRWE